MQQSRSSTGLSAARIELTVLAMALGVVLGIVLAVMRLSPNPVLSRGGLGLHLVLPRHPAYVLLLISATSASSTPSRHRLAVRRQIAGLFGRRRPAVLSSTPTTLITAVHGRASSAWGCPRRPTWPRSSGPASSRSTTGQTEAAQALGMSRAQTMRRIVLPQAMRVIVPPTGNETIAMLKDTSLLIARSRVTTELFFQLQHDRRSRTSRCSRC